MAEGGSGQFEKPGETVGSKEGKLPWYKKLVEALKSLKLDPSGGGYWDPDKQYGTKPLDPKGLSQDQRDLHP